MNRQFASRNFAGQDKGVLVIRKGGTLADKKGGYTDCLQRSCRLFLQSQIHNM